MTEKLSQNPTSNLPAEVSSFVGRRRELTEAKRLLSGARLLTLTGSGGVGKTRLAIRVATDIRRAFPDGVWLIELADLRNATLLPHTVAAVIGLHDGPTSWTVQTLAGHLRDKRMLLVLDNCEHLVDDCAEFAHGLLCAAADLQILATSRESLKALGEQVLTLPPLSTPPTDGGPTGDLLHYDAVQLFVARATARLPSFTLDSHNRDDVARLCHSLDGIPLAIELAADRVRAMTPKQINERLTSRLELLTTGARGVPTRQQTLRASIDWSYELCSEAEKALWERLSVFAGGFDLDAAEGVCAAADLPATEIADVLSSLLEKSVLIREERGSFVRYRMLEAIKEYGDDRVGKSGDRDAFKRRQRDWYAKLVFDAYDHWVGPQQAEWLTRLQLDHPNIRAALELSLADPDANEVALRIGRSLVDYWFACGQLSLGRHWLHEALSRCETPCAGQVDALCLGAFLAVTQNDYAAAARQLNEAEQTLRALEDPAGLAFWTFVSGVRAMFANDITQALELFDKALAGFRDCGDLTDEIRTLFMLGIACALGGEHDRAVTALQQCLQLTESRSESWFRSYALLGLGIDALAQSDNATAKRILRESIRLKQPLEDRVGLAWCYETLAWVSCNEADDKRASTLLGIADAAWKLAGTAMRTFVRTRDGHDACEGELRKRLPDRVFTAYWKGGADLPTEMALAYALGDGMPAVAPDGGTDFAPLTHREWQIAQAVAEGLTNRQIATRLVIAQRTAEGHVEHILTKLGFNSRAQIAAWVTERRVRCPISSPQAT